MPQFKRIEDETKSLSWLASEGEDAAIIRWTPKIAELYFCEKNKTGRVHDPDTQAKYNETAKNHLWELNFFDPILIGSGYLLNGGGRVGSLYETQQCADYFTVRSSCTEKDIRGVAGANKKHDLVKMLKVVMPRLKRPGDVLKALKFAVWLYSGRNIPIDTVPLFKRWYSLLEEEVLSITEEFADHRGKALQVVTGTLTLAHALSPKKVERFGREFHTQSWTSEDSPARICRVYFDKVGADEPEKDEQEVHLKELALRLLTCVDRYIDDIPMTRIAIDRGVLEKFRKPYEGGRIDKLLNSWAVSREQAKYPYINRGTKKWVRSATEEQGGQS